MRCNLAIFDKTYKVTGNQSLSGYAKGKGKLEFAEVAQITLSGALSGMELETGKKVANVLKKHPKHYAALKMVVQEMINTLNQLIKD